MTASNRNDRYDKLVDAMADYLRAEGWNPLVAGGIRIEQPIGNVRYNYELVIPFTGRPPEATTSGAGLGGDTAPLPDKSNSGREQ